MTNGRPPGASNPRPKGYPPGKRGGEPGRGTGRARPSPSPVLLGLIYGGIGLLALAIGAITFVVMALPTDFARREIAQQVKEATGRDLSIGGPASFTIFPSLGIRVGDVTLSSPPGMGGPPLLKAASLDVGVRLLPLLRQEIAVDRLVLREPVFDLRVDAQGRRSWDMAAGGLQRGRVRLAEAAPGRDALKDFSAGSPVLLAAADTGPAAGAQPLDIAELSLGDIRIVDGTVRYSDARSGDAATLDKINAEATLASLASPLGAKGSLVWAGEKLDFDGELTAPQDVLQQRPAKLTLSLSGNPLTMSYDGTVTAEDAPSAKGTVNAHAASLRALARWLGTELPPARGFGELSLAGLLNANAEALRLSDAKLSLDGATATGTIGVATAGARPHVVADLKVSGLDLNNYAADGAAPAESVPASPSATSPAPAAPPQSIEDLLNEPEQGPQVKGFTQRAGWSGEPIDLAALGLVDVDARLSVSDLALGHVRVNSSQLAVALKDRVLKTTFEEVKLYEGQGKGAFTLDGSGGEAQLAADLALSGIAAQPLLKDTAEIAWLAGTGDVTLALAGSGASEAAIIQSLSGKAQVAVRDGAIIGFNLGGAMRDLVEGKVPEFSSSPAAKTDFSEMTGSFLVKDGIAQNDDLQLASPLMRATGSGTVNLPERSIDYTVRPKLVATLEGQGGQQDLSGLEIPVHITGPWQDPEVTPDIAGVINNPDAVEAVKELGKELKGKNAGEIIEDLFGKKEEGEPSKAEKLLEKFLGK